MTECKHEGTIGCEEGYYQCKCGAMFQFVPNGPDDSGDWEQVGHVNEHNRREGDND